jgi:hypothetical protein
MSGCDGSEQDRGADGGQRAVERRLLGERQAAVSAGRFYRALAAGRPRALCAALAPEVRRQVARAEASTCEAQFRTLVGGAHNDRAQRRAAKAGVSGVRLHGDEATVTVSFGGGRTGVIELRRRAAEWRVTAFTLPPPHETERSADVGPRP